MVQHCLGQSVQCHEHCHVHCYVQYCIIKLPNILHVLFNAFMEALNDHALAHDLDVFYLFRMLPQLIVTDEVLDVGVLYFIRLV